MNQCNIIKIYTIFTMVRYKFYPSSHRLLTTRHWNISRDIKQGAKNFMVWRYWNHTESILLSLWNYVSINIKRFLTITHIFSSVVWHLQREIFDLAPESFKKVNRLKKTQRVFAEKKAIKWEINIKMRN